MLGHSLLIVGRITSWKDWSQQIYATVDEHFPELKQMCCASNLLYKTFVLPMATHQDLPWNVSNKQKPPRWIEDLVKSEFWETRQQPSKQQPSKRKRSPKDVDGDEDTGDDEDHNSDLDNNGDMDADDNGNDETGFVEEGSIHSDPEAENGIQFRHTGGHRRNPRRGVPPPYARVGMTPEQDDIIQQLDNEESPSSQQVSTTVTEPDEPIQPLDNEQSPSSHQVRTTVTEPDDPIQPLDNEQSPSSQQISTTVTEPDDPI